MVRCVAYDETFEPILTGQARKSNYSLSILFTHYVPNTYYMQFIYKYHSSLHVCFLL